MQIRSTPTFSYYSRELRTRTASFKEFGSWHISADSEEYVAIDAEGDDPAVMGFANLYFHFEPGDVAVKDVVGQTITVDVEALGEPSFYDGIHHLLSELTLRVLAVDDDAVELVVEGKLENDEQAEFRVSGWFPIDNSPPAWAQGLA